MQDADRQTRKTNAFDLEDSTCSQGRLSSAPGDRELVAPERPVGRMGVLLVGHGTRDPHGIQAFSELVHQVRERLSGTPLAPAFLEFAEPTIEQGVNRLAEAGVARIGVVPLMLLAGGHVRRDIPRSVADAAAKHPGLETFQTAHLGCSPQMVQLSAERLQEALVSAQHANDSTAVLLVGRGTRDSDALEEMSCFAQLRRTATPETPLEVCFLSLAQPSLEKAIVSAVSWPQGRIVIQPHLLFPGRLFDRLARTVRNIESRCSEKVWIIAQPLGPDQLLADTVATLLGNGSATPVSGVRTTETPGS